MTVKFNDLILNKNTTSKELSFDVKTGSQDSKGKDLVHKFKARVKFMPAMVGAKFVKNKADDDLSESLYRMAKLCAEYVESWDITVGWLKNFFPFETKSDVADDTILSCDTATVEFVMVQIPLIAQQIFTEARKIENFKAVSDLKN